MAFLSLVFGTGREKSRIGALQLDALLTEETKLSSVVTSYPVETGGEITDHIAQEPEELSITGQVTGASTLMFGGGGRSHLIQSKEALRQIHRERLPVTIVTGMDTYDGYAMTSAVITRDNTGDRFEVDAQFRRISFADVQEAEIPAEQVASPTKGRAGKTAQKAGSVSESSASSVTPDEAAPPERRKSWLRVISDKVTGK